MSKTVQTVKNMHSTLSMYYTYFVSAAVTVKSSFTDIDHYFAPKWQALVMGIATVVVVIDKVRRSVPDDEPPATP